MGKAIRNFKDGINGVEEAKFRHLPPEGEKKTVESPETALKPASESDKPPV